jgi:hypothetical protein
MRVLIIILLFSLNASATNYYVSNTGSDAAAGTSTGAAWQTIAKVNATSFLPGDSILLKNGDSWREQLKPISSGSSGNVIYIGAYGSGAKPLLTGFQTLTMSDAGSNIWTATATNSVKKQNTVFINGSLRAKARFPNTGYLTLTYAGSTQNSIVTSLTGTPNYTGSEIVIRTRHWILDVPKITSQSGGTLNLSPSLSDPISSSYGGNGYFLQNMEQFLDVIGEWYYDSATKVIKVYATSAPNVQVSTIDTVINLKSRSYITIDGLNIAGGNIGGLQIDSSSYISVINCLITDCGDGMIGHENSYTNVSSDTVRNTLSGGISLGARQFTAAGVGGDNYALANNNNTTIGNNYIKNIASIAGMGRSLNGTYIGIYIIGANNTVTNNRIDSIGYIGIHFGGINTLIKNNFVSTFCYVKDDGAGIYNFIGVTYPTDFSDGSIIRSNILINGIGAPAGTSFVSVGSGIYMDELSNDILIDSNTVSNCYEAAFFVNQGSKLTYKDNLAVNGVGTGMTIVGSNAAVTANILKRNSFYISNSSYDIFYRKNGTSLGTMDSNYYSRPSLETAILNNNGTTYSLALWQSTTGQDANSKGTPIYVTGAAPTLYYNTTAAVTNTALAGLHVNSKGGFVNNNLFLQPFTSSLLFKSTYEIKPITTNIKYFKVIGL